MSERFGVCPCCNIARLRILAWEGVSLCHRDQQDFDRVGHGRLGMSTDFWYKDKPIFGTNVVNFNMFKMTNLSRVSCCTQHIIVGARARECS